MLPEVQRRRYSRYDYSTDVGIHESRDKHKRLGRCINISQGGILVKADPVPDCGTIVTLLISLPDLREISEISCEVRWSNPGVETAGLQFTRPRPIELWGINKLMHRLIALGT